MRYWIWLSQRKMSNLQKRHLLEMFTGPKEIFEADWDSYAQAVPGDLRETLEDRDLQQAERIEKLCRKNSIGILTIDSSGYPPRLRNTEDAPVLLYFRGKPPKWEQELLIGIVGTRKLSPYGQMCALRFGKQIASCGGIVVSGGAAGVDALAMDGALALDKPVVCVLGTGVDVAYPRENAALFEKTAVCGCLLSEYPPGTRGRPWQFPQRNRIISGICSGVVVVEAPEKSGALITAAYAREQGRDVFAVPGNVSSDSCVGSNRLLQQGALAAMSGWDVVKEYVNLYSHLEKAPGSADLTQENQPVLVGQIPKIPAQKPEENQPDRKKPIDKKEKSSYSVSERRPQLSAQEQQVLSLLKEEIQQTDDILARLDMPSGKALSILTKLTLMGLAQSYPGKGISLK